MKLRVIMVAIAGLWALTPPAKAANYPCSGKKGGVSHCLGSYFVCKDGSTSQSKRICTAGSTGGGGQEPTHGSGGSRKVRR